MDFLVNRDDLRECRVAETEPPRLAHDQALLEVNAFGLTSNNITYAVFGQSMSYWDFFPAPEGWGRVPVWGFAEVVEGANGLKPGTRVFGYLPPSTHLVVLPDRVDERGFVDAATHRRKLPSAYQGYRLVDGDPAYRERYEDQQMLLWPLFYTSFLIDDFLADERMFGAEVAVLSSASSKTALVAAYLLAQRGTEVIGLTSAGNVGFVERTGVYGRVLTYDEIDSLPNERAVYLDISGDARVRSEIHRHYGESLAHSSIVGATHWDRMAGGTRRLPGRRPKFFFAPDRIRKRVRQWGAAGLNSRVAEAWHPFVEWTEGWLEVRHGEGPEAIKHAYLELLEGRTDPSVGHVLSPAPAPDGETSFEP